MPEATSNNLDVKKYISISIVITILSQVSLSVYYKRFGFNALPYYEPSEILMSSIKDFTLISIGLFLFIQTIIPIKGRTNRDGEESDINESLPGSNKIIAYFKRNKGIYSMIAIQITFLAISWYKHHFYVGILLMILYFLGMELIVFNRRAFSKLEETNPAFFENNKSRFPDIELALLVLAFSYVTFTCLMADAKASTVLHSNKHIGSSIVLSSDEKIIITRQVLIIGKSKEYIFIYNKPDSSIRILKRSEVVKEVIKNNDNATFDNLFSAF